MARLCLYAKDIMKRVNVTNFKKSLSKFTTGITVVCIREDAKVYGKTVNSFNTLSLKPPLVLFSLGNNSSSIKNYISKYLSINILSKNQKKISEFFRKNILIIVKLNFRMAE